LRVKHWQLAAWKDAVVGTFEPASGANGTVCRNPAAYKRLCLCGSVYVRFAVLMMG
jgi:hypothetical protein